MVMRLKGYEHRQGGHWWAVNGGSAGSAEFCVRGGVVKHLGEPTKVIAALN